MYHAAATALNARIATMTTSQLNARRVQLLECAAECRRSNLHRIAENVDAEWAIVDAAWRARSAH